MASLSRHSQIVSGIRKVTNKSSASTPHNNNTPNYSSRRIYGKRPRLPKRLNLDVTAYDYPGEEILNQIEIDEKSLVLLGTGTLSLYEDFDEILVDKEIASTISRFPSVIQTAENLESSYLFLKRDGRRKKYSVHVHGENFKYDAISLKDLKTKDSKTVYIVFKNKISNSNLNTTKQSRKTKRISTALTIEDSNLSSDDDNLLNVSPFISNSRLSVETSVNQSLKCSDEKVISVYLI